MPNAGDWLTVAEAARRMGVSVQAVRARIKRGSLDSQRDNRGRMLVRVATDEATPVATAADTLRERVARLEERVAAGDAARADLRQQLDEVKAERERLLAIIERLSEERREPRRQWPGLRRWWRRVWEGED